MKSYINEVFRSIAEINKVKLKFEILAKTQTPLKEHNKI